MYFIRSNNGLWLWWAGTIDRVLARRNDQQWTVRASEATPYLDKAHAVNAVFVLGEESGLVIVEAESAAALQQQPTRGPG